MCVPFVLHVHCRQYKVQNWWVLRVYITKYVFIYDGTYIFLNVENQVYYVADFSTDTI